VIRAGLPWSWGATDAERLADHPCAALVPHRAHRMIRAVDVAAPAATTFRRRPGPARSFGPMACTYRWCRTASATRLIGRLDLTAEGGLLGTPVAWGLVMMRKQLRTPAAPAGRG
jgi:hypothetical protein